MIKKCLNCNKDFEPNKHYKKKKFCCNSCRGKWQYKNGKNLPPLQFGLIPWNKNMVGWTKKFKNAGFQKGKFNPSWNGGSSTYKEKHRKEWNRWRKEVFERDDFTCQICGKKGGEIHPDHIKCFAHFKKLRFDVGNGRTLCKECHKETPNYGNHDKSFCIKLGADLNL